jgi:hypothetical protein
MLYSLQRGEELLDKGKVTDTSLFVSCNPIKSNIDLKYKKLYLKNDG